MIKIGYEIETGKEVSIQPSHLIVTGVTQLSGKTTTLEALIQRSGLKAIVFKTKIGEKGFSQGTVIPPFFRDRSDYDFVKSLIEAYTKEKLFIEKGTLMTLCKGAGSLIDIKKRVDDVISEGKVRGLKEEIYVRLQHYLENLIPQIQYANFSKVLNIEDGINIMNLERFTEEAQSLIIQSVADEVLKTMKGVVLVIPEAWKFLPQRYNNPCKRVVESFIRQGATNKNFVWIDSQDMAGVDKTALKQVSTWILGYQSERNEVKHTLDQISLPKKAKPKEEDIMTLRKGHFFVSSYEGVKKVYVQPVWLNDDQAIDIAKGVLDVDTVKVPDNLTPYKTVSATSEIEKVPAFDDTKLRADVIELRSDFFNKVQELQDYIQKIASELYVVQSQKKEVNEDELLSKLLQKMPTQVGTQINEESIISKVLAKVPKGSGAVTYEVEPLVKIRKEFLQEAKNKIISDVESLTSQEKKVLKYLEVRGVGLSVSEIATKGLLYPNGAGNFAKIVNTAMKTISEKILGEKQTNGKCFGKIKKRIESILLDKEATPQEIQQVYDHIMMEMLK